LEADVGISLHFAHLETHFSFRTRLLDCIWTALPIIVTRGDVLSSLVREHQLGWVVDYESVDEVTVAILESIEAPREGFKDRFAAVASQLRWTTVMKPLIDFCRNPRYAPDRGQAKSDLHSLSMLKLISQINAFQRDIGARDHRLARLEGALREREARIADFERKVLTGQMALANLRNQLAIRDGQIEARDAAIEARDAAIEARDAAIERLEGVIDQIRQGRVMRLLDGINQMIASIRHILTGDSAK
jgi:hypothetical protein